MTDHNMASLGWGAQAGLSSPGWSQAECNLALAITNCEFLPSYDTYHSRVTRVTRVT